MSASAISSWFVRRDIAPPCSSPKPRCASCRGTRGPRNAGNRESRRSGRFPARSNSPSAACDSPRHRAVAMFRQEHDTVRPRNAMGSVRGRVLGFRKAAGGHTRTSRRFQKSRDRCIRACAFQSRPSDGCPQRQRLRGFAPLRRFSPWCCRCPSREFSRRRHVRKFSEHRKNVKDRRAESRIKSESAAQAFTSS